MGYSPTRCCKLHSRLATTAPSLLMEGQKSNIIVIQNTKGEYFMLRTSVTGYNVPIASTALTSQAANNDYNCEWTGKKSRGRGNKNYNEVAITYKDQTINVYTLDGKIYSKGGVCGANFTQITCNGATILYTNIQKKPSDDILRALGFTVAAPYSSDPPETNASTQVSAAPGATVSPQEISEWEDDRIAQLQRVQRYYGYTEGIKCNLDGKVHYFKYLSGESPDCVWVTCDAPTASPTGTPPTAMNASPTPPPQP